MILRHWPKCFYCRTATPMHGDGCLVAAYGALLVNAKAVKDETKREPKWPTCPVCARAVGRRVRQVQPFRALRRHTFRVPHRSHCELAAYQANCERMRRSD